MLGRISVCEVSESVIVLRHSRSSRTPEAGSSNQNGLMSCRWSYIRKAISYFHLPPLIIGDLIVSVRHGALKRPEDEINLRTLHALNNIELLELQFHNRLFCAVLASTARMEGLGRSSGHAFYFEDPSSIPTGCFSVFILYEKTKIDGKRGRGLPT